jgi:hypothetical protein
MDRLKLEDALVKAHTAGDFEAANLFAAELKTLKAPPNPAKDFGGLPLRPFGVDTGVTMPQGVSNFMAGAGQALKNIGRGAQQIAGKDVSADVVESRRLDKPLTDTGAGFAGSLTGNIAALAPTALIPGVNTLTGAAASGALAGALQPVIGEESRGANAGLGAALGLGGQAAGNTIARAIRPVRGALSPEMQRLAASAQAEGIPLSLAQQTGSRPMQLVESVMENLPLTSGRQLASKQAQTEAFNRAVLSRAGVSGNVATPSVLAQQKETVGKQLGDIAERNVLDFGQGLVTKLADITDNATKHLPPESAKKVAGTVDQILSQVGPQNVMAGSNYQGWREPLRALAKKGDETAHFYGQIRSALDNAFKTQLPGAEGQAFRDLSRQYGNVKTIANAMGGAGAGTKLGNISPAQLESALTQSVGREGKALGRGDLNNLVSIGRNFVSDNIPNSGTAQRQLAQSLLTGGGGAGLGALGAGLSGQSPWEGAALGAGIGAVGLTMPRLVQSLMQNPVGSAYLTRGLAEMTPAQRALINAAARGGALGLGFAE